MGHGLYNVQSNFWGAERPTPDYACALCGLRLLPEDVRKAGVAAVDSTQRKAPGLHHMAFEVESREDWLHALDHVRGCGIELVMGPYVHAPEGGERGFVGGSGSHAFYFLDPDGNRIEIYCWMIRSPARAWRRPIRICECGSSRGALGPSRTREAEAPSRIVLPPGHCRA
jgi:catechol 2,3-dioxygenase-like lactoylglutathione lyase family enzyme